MTGEITLRGHILPVGGIKEKVIAAYRSNVGTVILPKENESEISELDETIKKKIRFIFASNMTTVLENALVLNSNTMDLQCNKYDVNNKVKKF